MTLHDTTQHPEPTRFTSQMSRDAFPSRELSLSGSSRFSSQPPSTRRVGSGKHLELVFEDYLDRPLRQLTEDSSRVETLVLRALSSLGLEIRPQRRRLRLHRRRHLR